jgi:hypothetical protein
MGSQNLSHGINSGLPRPLVADTTSSQVLDYHKILRNSRSASDKRLLHRDREKYFWVGQAAPLTSDFHFRFVFTPSETANNSETVTDGRELFAEH